MQGASPPYVAWLEQLCDVLFQVEPEIVPELAQDGRLRPLVHCWMGTKLRYWDMNLARFGRTSSKSIVNDAVCRAVVRAGLATGAPGDAEAWLSAQGAVVRAAFEMANVKLTTLSGGFGSNASVVENLEGLTKVVTTLPALCRSRRSRWLR